MWLLSTSIIHMIIEKCTILNWIHIPVVHLYVHFTDFLRQHWWYLYCNQYLTNASERIVRPFVPANVGGIPGFEARISGMPCILAKSSSTDAYYFTFLLTVCLPSLRGDLKLNVMCARHCVFSWKIGFDNRKQMHILTI